MKSFLAVCAVLISISGALAQEKGKAEARITPEQAAKKIGESAVVRGKVVQVNKREKVCNLNFGGSFPKHVFEAVIFATDFKTFPELEKLEGKTVELNGKITDYKGKPQMVLKTRSQLKVVE
jgi:DNA/RNA endonuclease YhcR with UshA esterase domain